MDRDMMERRTFLRGASALVAAGLVGCGSKDDTGDTADTDLAATGSGTGSTGTGTGATGSGTGATGSGTGATGTGTGATGTGTGATGTGTGMTGTGTGTGTGMTGTGTGMTGTGTGSVSCSVADASGPDGEGHGHVLSIPVADLLSPADKTYTITGGSHGHSVFVTAAQLTELATNCTVTVTSNDTHSHTWIVTIP